MNIEEDVNSTATPNLDAPFDETGLIQELVAQFLAHDGYVETARAFAQEVQAESTALQNRPSSIKQYTAEEDLDAINRQRMLAPYFSLFHAYIPRNTSRHPRRRHRQSPQTHQRLLLLRPPRQPTHPLPAPLPQIH